MHGFFVDDEKVNSLQEINFFRRVYPSLFGQMEGIPTDFIEMQSTLFGFNTQEAPRDPRRKDCQAPQPLWDEEDNIDWRNFMN